ncbi:MAG: sigma-70 family RNA polymerase sigma factor [Anaerolineae bacterium]|nr:sigma-70 family RNA polymerase sigma factor [Anaerolineae bacterium]
MDDFPTQHDDEQRLVRAAQHDPQQFRPVFQRFHPRVFAYVASRVGSPDDAEDITAEVFLRVVEGLGKFQDRGPGSFAGWVFRIAYHEVVRHAGRVKNRPAVPLDALPDLPSHDLSPEDAAQQHDRTRTVRAALAGLTPRQQEMVTLRYYGGLRNKEIADVLGLDERTVAATLSRALGQLRALLTETPEAATALQETDPWT